MDTRPSAGSNLFYNLFALHRVRFLCGAYLVCQLSLFVYLACVPGIYDRLGFVRGRDLIQFYISGRIVAQGDAERLYDNDFFLQIQNEITPPDESHKDQRPRYYSLYPPTMALIFSPLAKLSYEQFVGLGIAWTVIGYVFASRWILKDLNAPAAWRTTALLGILGFHAALVMLWNCQFSWLWLLGFMACFRLRRMARPFVAGLCLSVLTLKPQFAAFAVLWLLMRQGWQTLAGLLIGFVAQATVVSVILGPEIWRDYFAGARIYSKMNAIFVFSPDYQQAIMGTVQAALGHHQIWIAQGVYAAVLAFVLLLSFRIFRLRTIEHRTEESTVILMVLLSMPHLLIYDLVLLLIPIGHLFSLHQDRPAVIPKWPAISLYLLTMIAPIYTTFPGFSLIPIAMLVTLGLMSARALGNGDRFINN